MAQYALPKQQPLSAGKPAVSPSAAVAHDLLDTQVGLLVAKFAPQYSNRIPPDKAQQTFRQVLKTADFMTKGFVMSIVGQHLPKGVTAEDITKAVNEAPPAATEPPAEAPTALTHDGLPARRNADGTHSTEVTVTVTDPRINGGAPTNIPSLWGGVEVSEDEAVSRVLKSGKSYPAFRSIPEAVSAAKARSQAGGAAAAPAAAAPAAGSAAAVPAFAPPRIPTAAGASEHYRKMREPFAAELRDPATRRLVRGIISAENPGAGSAVVESLMNRTAMVNEARAAKGQPPLTLKAMIQGDASLGGKSFYGPVRTGAINEHMARTDADKSYSAKLDSYITSALGGANTIGGHTDQGSKGDPNYDKGGIGVNINGERFNDWGYGGSRAWREKNQALAGSTTTSAAEYPDPTPDVGAGQSYYDEKSRYEAENPAAIAAAPTQGALADAVAPPSAKATDYQGIVGDAFGDLGKIFAGGAAQNAARGSGPATVPTATPVTPTGAFPMVDPKTVEAQRQQLALAMQRLNSGKLV